MQKRREARAAQMESRRTTTASRREQLSQRKRERNEGNTEKPRTESTRVVSKKRPTVLQNSRKLNRKSRLYRRIDLGRNGLNRHPDSGKIVRRSMASRRLRLQTASRTVRQNVRWCRTSRKHDIQCQKDWTKKPLVRSSNSGKPEKSRANSGVRRAEVSASDEKGGNGRCPGFGTADCFTSVDVSDYRFG